MGSAAYRNGGSRMERRLSKKSIALLDEVNTLASQLAMIIAQHSTPHGR